MASEVTKAIDKNNKVQPAPCTNTNNASMQSNVITNQPRISQGQTPSEKTPPQSNSERGKEETAACCRDMANLCFCCTWFSETWYCGLLINWRLEYVIGQKSFGKNWQKYGIENTVSRFLSNICVQMSEKNQQCSDGWQKCYPTKNFVLRIFCPKYFCPKRFATRFLRLNDSMVYFQEG